MQDTKPFDLPSDVRAMLAPSSMRLVLNRRGSTVWEVATCKGRYAVKLGYPSGPQHDYTKLAPAREGEVLRQLRADDVAYGVWEHGTWNVQPWRDGVSLWDLWAPYREGRAGVPPLSDAVSCVDALAALHGAGWAHGDVQPAHFILDGERTHLIDLALAHGGTEPLLHDFGFRGCLVHYESPEISRSVLSSGYATPSVAGDVYGLGASLLISATGQRAVEYLDDAERAVQRQAVAEGRYRPFDVPGALGWVIGWMLSHEPSDRPSLVEVREALGKELPE